MTEPLIRVALVHNDAKKEMVDFHKHFMAAMQQTIIDPRYRLIASRDLRLQTMTQFVTYKDEQSIRHDVERDLVIVFYGPTTPSTETPRVEFGSKAQVTHDKVRVFCAPKTNKHAIVDSQPFFIEVVSGGVRHRFEFASVMSLDGNETFVKLSEVITWIGYRKVVQHLQQQKSGWQKWVVMGTALLIAGRVISQYQPGIKAAWDTVTSNGVEGGAWWDRLKQLGQWIPSAWTEWMSRVSQSLPPQAGQMVNDLIADAQSSTASKTQDQRVLKGVMSSKASVHAKLPKTIHELFPKSIRVNDEQWSIVLESTDQPPGTTEEPFGFEVVLEGHSSRYATHASINAFIERYNRNDFQIKPLTLVLLSYSADKSIEEQEKAKKSVNQAIEHYKQKIQPNGKRVFLIAFSTHLDTLRSLPIASGIEFLQTPVAQSEVQQPLIVNGTESLVPSIEQILVNYIATNLLTTLPQ